MKETLQKRYLLFLFQTLAFIFILNLPRGYAQINWDGDNSVGRFIYDDNWYGNTQPTWSSSFDLNFHYNNGNQTSMYFNYGSWRDVQSIIYKETYLKPTSRDFVVLDGDGNGLNFSNKIENNATFTQYIRVPLSFKGPNEPNQLQLNPVKGDLILDNNLPLYNDNKVSYDVWGNNNHHLILGNRPYGNSSTKININQYSIVEIANDMASHSECFGGGVNINTGELWFNAGSSINGGVITVGAGDSKTAKVFLNDVDGGLTINNHIVVPSGSTDSHIGGLNSSGTNTYSGNVTLNASSYLETWAGGTTNFFGDITGSGGITIRPVSGTNATVQFSGTSKTYTGTTTIKSGAILKISSNQSLGNISLESGGTLVIDNSVSLTINGTWTGGGTLINNGTIILAGPASFPGSSTTVSAMNNLTLNKSGITNLDKDITISGQYNLTSGILNIGSQNLTFDNAATIVNGNTPDATNMIQADGSGKVIKNFNAPGSFTFPIGDNTGTAEYSPATINLTSVTGTVSVAINVVNAKHPNNTTATSFINRYWRVTATGTYTGDASFTYLTSDVTGNENLIRTGGYAGGSWYLFNLANTTSHILTVTNQSDLTKDFTGGDTFSPLATSPNSHFRSNGLGNEWSVPGNWDASPDKIIWTTATIAPTSDAESITIQSGHQIEITNGISLNNTSVFGTLSLFTGGTINIPKSSADGINIKAGGTFIVATTGNYSPSFTLPVSASFTTYPIHVETDGKIIINKPSSGTPGTDYENLATRSGNKWENKSKFIWNNGLAFGTSNVTFFPNNGDDDIPVFIIGPTAISGDMTNGASSPFNVKGLTVINANTTFKGGGNKIFRNGIAGNATLTQDGSINDPGNFQITGNNAILGGSNLTLNLTDILNLNSNVEVPLDSSVIINKNTGKSTSGSISKASNVVFTVNGTADMTTINMNNGSGSLTINGYLKTAAADGLKGSTNATVTSGTVNVNSGSTIEYYATTDQKITTTSTLDNQKYYHLVLSGDQTKAPFNSNPIKIDDAGSLIITGPSTLIVDAMTNNIGPENTGNTTSFTMDGGRLRLGTLGFTGSGTLPSMKGAYNLIRGVIEFAGGTSSTSQSIRSGDSYEYFAIEASGPYVATSGGNVNLKDDGSFTVKNGGKFTININSIKGVNPSGNAYVKVENGGTINVGNTGGFNGRSPAAIGDTTSAVHANISNIILDEGSTINYSRSSPQLTGPGDQPITTGGFTYQNLTLSGTGNKIAPFKSNLQINGNFTVQGAAQFDHDSSTVSFINSTDAQDINAAGVTYPPVFYNLTNQNTAGLNVNNFISVKSELTLSDDSKINLEDSIRLISDNDQTASVAPIPEGANAATITYDTKGAFIVERYIPNHSKAWQLLSVPTKGSTIRAAWQNNQNYYPGKGVNIPSPYWTLGDPKGFDGSSYGHSMKTYDPGTDSYIGVTNTANNIDNPNGYFLFVRGDRSATDIWSPTTAVTLQTAGRLYAPTPAGEGPVSVTVPANSFAMVGNPYASAIKYDQLTFSPNLQDDYYIWDPQLTTKPSVYGLGAFRTITKDDGSATPSSGNYINGAIPPIQSGQAFFVYNPSATPGSVTFSESAKVSGSASVFKPQRKEENEIVGLTVNLSTNPDGKNVILDGVRFFFNENYSAAVNQQDAQKLGSSSEGISIIAKPYPLSIERRPLPTENDTIFFGLSGMKRQTYSLSIDAGEMIKSGYKVFLHDAHNKGTIELESAITKTDFVINTNPASSAPNRFFLTFKPAIPPFAFANEKATAAEDHITLTWRGLNQSQVASFHIEHSADGATFANAGSAEVKTGATADYLFTTIAPKSGINYYRVKAIMKDGSIMYSHVLSASVHLGASVMYISPNPVREVIRLHLYRMAKGDYRIQVYTMDGKRVLSRKITHAGGSADFNITPQGMAKGLYQLEIYKPDGSKASQLLMLDK